ncbi:MAG: CRTAC1 family protein [Acidobacteriaceae bacterium]
MFARRALRRDLVASGLLLGWALALIPAVCGAQGLPAAPVQAPQQGPSTGGVNTGGTHAAVLDAQHRPITAGGFVDAGPTVFANVTEAAGLDKWTHRSGTIAKQFILETPGSGVGLIDYDNDGWLDIYLVNGSTYEAFAGKGPAPHAALFHNNHDGTFTGVAAKAGVTNERWGFGVAVGDYDNDGWPDLYVTNFGKNRLYHNNHDGTFTDVAEKAGVTLGGWSTGATWGDYDGDGRLDLFVPGYVHYENDQPPSPNDPGKVATNFCQFRGAPVMCGPRGLKGEHDHLFHNNGDGTFTDVSEKAGVSDPNGYYGLSSVFVDLNNDGKLDLVVADDSTPNYVYLNKGNGTFEDASYASGYALNENGRETASMGIAVGDYQNNGRIDLFNTTFSDDYDVLYHNDGDANFTDVSYQGGVAEVSIPFLGWGDGFLDYDNDGWKDLFVANGHVYPSVDKNDWGTTFAQRPLLFHNVKGQRFELVPAVKGTGLAVVQPGRGAAFGDLFNDGRMDVVINNMDHPPTLLKNVNPDKHHWVALKLVGGSKNPGGPKSPRDAVGATVYLASGGIKQRGDVLSGGSYASSNDQRVHFGLGDATTVQSVEIHWPSGAVEKISLPAVDRIYTVEEGKGITAKGVNAKSKKG